MFQFLPAVLSLAAKIAPAALKAAPAIAKAAPAAAQTTGGLGKLLSAGKALTTKEGLLAAGKKLATKEGLQQASQGMTEAGAVYGALFPPSQQPNIQRYNPNAYASTQQRPQLKDLLRSGY